MSSNSRPRYTPLYSGGTGEHPPSALQDLSTDKLPYLQGREEAAEGREPSTPHCMGSFCNSCCYLLLVIHGLQLYYNRDLFEFPLYFSLASVSEIPKGQEGPEPCNSI